ncbi:MAG TPA: N-acetyltransferase [Clostridiales bacterium]|jgi:ribosomal protein S18 acetylase RimI-like enzyme|nr:N-acetyltransferase [Clostridiales bacterium]
MEKIRPYQEKDFDRVRKICLENAGDTRTEEQKIFILSTYCDYYIEQEPENCFVAVNENDEAVGYIFCAENFDIFKDRFKEIYLPRVKALGSDKWKDSLESYQLHEKYKGIYPAHLHLDVDAAYQRRGLGGRLSDSLIDHLRTKGIGGLMFTVGADNKVGLSFYNKYGFEKIEEGSDDVAMGIKIG